MGLGGTAKKLQKVADAAENLYAKMNEIIGELKDLQREVEETSGQVDRVERDLAEQRALVEALAAEQGIDVESVLAEADLPPDPGADGDASGEPAHSDAGGGGETGDGDAGERNDGNTGGTSDGAEVPVTDESA